MQYILLLGLELSKVWLENSPVIRLGRRCIYTLDGAVKLNKLLLT